MANDFSIKSDILKFDLRGLSSNALATSVERALADHLTVLQQRYSRGQKPDKTKQKSVGKNTLNRLGEKHFRAGRPSHLSDQGDLRKSMVTTRQGVKNGAKIILSGNHPTGKPNAQIAKELNDRGFKNTYLSGDDMDSLTGAVVDELMQQHLKKLVQIEKKGK